MFDPLPSHGLQYPRLLSVSQCLLKFMSIELVMGGGGLANLKRKTTPPPPHTHIQTQHLRYCFFLFHCSCSRSRFWLVQTRPRKQMSESACNVGDLGLIPGWGKSSEEENVNPLQYSYLGHSMDIGACLATVHGLQRVGHD